MELFNTSNDLKTFDELLQENRCLDAELAAALQRHRAVHGIQNAVAVDDANFDPTSDFGKLVIWGKLATQKGSRVSPQIRIYIAKAVFWREEVRQLLVLKAPAADNKKKEQTKKRKADVEHSNEQQSRTVDSGGVKPASTAAVVNKSPICPESYRAQRMAELEVIYRRYLSQHRGLALATVMPVFDPATDLGRLILGGYLLRPVQMRIAPHHQRLVDEEWARLQPDVALAQQRELQVVMGIPFVPSPTVVMSYDYSPLLLCAERAPAVIPHLDSSDGGPMEAAASTGVHPIGTPTNTALVPVMALPTLSQPSTGLAESQQPSEPIRKRKDRGNGKNKRKAGAMPRATEDCAVAADVLNYKQELMLRLLG